LSVSENLVIKALADPALSMQGFVLFLEEIEQAFVCFLTTSDFLAAMVGLVSLYCILYIVVVFVVLWTHESGIKKFIYSLTEECTDFFF